ncbi:MAG: hypothetical protein HKN32_06970, partial [Flavobacteriales bacterium]|nr:hypothetical protein [Flavobacteriales bacterium]
VTTVQEFIGQGSRQSPLNIYTDSPGLEASLVKSSGAVDLDYLILKDVHASGGAIFNATNCLDEGNNMGWNITAIEIWDFYWVSNGGDWEDLDHWSNVSGGAPYYADVPSQFDNVFFDAASFTLNDQQVTCNDPVSMRDLNCTGVEFNPTFQAGYGDKLSIYGNVNFTEGMQKAINNIDFLGTGDYTVYLGENGSVSYPSFWGGGSWTLESDVTCATFKLLDGTVDLNDHDVHCTFNFEEGNFNASTYFLGTGEIHCNNFTIQSDDATVNSEQAQIFVSNNFSGNEFAYHTLTLEGEGTILGSTTFEFLEFAPGVLAQIEAGTTQTVNQAIMAAGTPDQPINISSDVEGEAGLLSQASGTVEGSYLVLKDSHAIGGATFNAAQSIDNGNNLGWNITEIAPQNFYWVGGTGDWSDAGNHWASTSGGSSFYSFPPGVLDNVFFDENSFSAAGQTVTIDADAVNFHDMDWSMATNNPHLEGFGKAMNVYGSLEFSSSMSSNVSDFNFLSGESEIFDPGYVDSPGLNSHLNFSGGGSWTLQSGLTV